jgi:hypothetical protein
MQDVSDKLLGQFIACIEGKIGEANPVAATPADEVPGPPAQAPAPVPLAPEALAPVAPKPPATPPEEQDALDLGSTVLPVLLRSYGKQIVGGVVVVVAVIVVWRAMSG